MVRLPYPEYNHIETHSVNLTVVANLMLMPADVCMMVGDVVKFKVIHVSNIIQIYFTSMFNVSEKPDLILVYCRFIFLCFEMLSSGISFVHIKYEEHMINNYFF